MIQFFVAWSHLQKILDIKGIQFLTLHLQVLFCRIVAELGVSLGQTLQTWNEAIMNQHFLIECNRLNKCYKNTISLFFCTAGVDRDALKPHDEGCRHPDLFWVGSCIQQRHSGGCRQHLHVCLLPGQWHQFNNILKSITVRVATKLVID